MGNYDHFFLILGRDHGTDLNNPSAWNKETVVLDPFAYTCYPGKDITANMEFLISRNIISGQGEVNKFYVHSDNEVSSTKQPIE